MVTKNYCDICKKEIKAIGDISELKMTPNTISEIGTREEICKDCYDKIKNYINNMRIKW